MDSDGNFMWGTNGTVFSNSTEPYGKISLDKVYDQYVCLSWVDKYVDDGDLYAQLLNRFGLPEWKENGTVICNSSGGINTFKAVYDGEDGVFFTWTDERAGNGIYDTYIQRINEEEKLSWDHNGMAIENLHSNSLAPQLIQ